MTPHDARLGRLIGVAILAAGLALPAAAQTRIGGSAMKLGGAQGQHMPNGGGRGMRQQAPPLQPRSTPKVAPGGRSMKIQSAPRSVTPPASSPQRIERPAMDRRGDNGNGFNRPISPGTGFPGATWGSGSSSGVSIDGSYNGDKWRLGFHVGSGYPWHGHCPDDPKHPHKPCPPITYPPISWGWPVWWYDNGWGYYGNRYDTIYGVYSPPDPSMSAAQPDMSAPAPQQEAQPATAREQADAYLRAGNARSAVGMYKAHLRQYPGDEDALRMLGMALLDLGQLPEGAATIGRAYRADPSLADTPLPADVYGSAERLRANLNRVSIYANRARSASGWLTLTLLMQAEGRYDVARAMLERAIDAGLEANLAGRLGASLNVR